MSAAQEGEGRGQVHEQLDEARVLRCALSVDCGAHEQERLRKERNWIATIGLRRKRASPPRCPHILSARRFHRCVGRDLAHTNPAELPPVHESRREQISNCGRSRDPELLRFSLGADQCAVSGDFFVDLFCLRSRVDLVSGCAVRGDRSLAPISATTASCKSDTCSGLVGVGSFECPSARAAR
jgi:hypothetical protein